ncbi:MAG: hypothetical protein Q4A52_07040 [Bacillota bacterium]|nr:hypothetical protein [Bacillota bacterium]
MINCSKCGTENDATSNFCKKCGNSLSVTPQPKSDLATSPEITAPKTETVQPPAPELHAVTTEPQVATEPKVAATEPKGVTEPKPAESTVNPESAETTKPPEHQVQSQDKKEKAGKPLPLKTILMIGVPVLLLLLILMIVPSMFQKSSLVATKNSIHYDTVDGELFVAFGEQVVEIGESSGYDVSENMYGDKAAVTVRDGGDRILYYVAANMKEKVKVHDSVNGAAISQTGSKIYFMVQDDDQTNELHVYDTASKKTNKITSQMQASYRLPGIESVAISPDGNTIAYCSEIDGEDITYKVLVNNKEFETIKNGIVIGVSDNANYIYYVKQRNSDYTLYVKPGKKDEIKLLNDIGKISFNVDLSEVLVSNNKGTYLSRRGQEKQKINSGTDHSLLLNYDTVHRYLSEFTRIVGVPTFSNRIIRTGENIWKIDPKGEGSKKINSRARLAFLNKNSDLLFVLQNDDLNVYFPNNLQKEKVQYAEDVLTFNLSDDGKMIAYVNSDYELMVKKGPNDKGKRIADDIELRNGYGEMLFAPNGTLFFVSEDELYMSRNGGEKQRIKEISDVLSIYRNGKFIYVMTEDDTYIGTGDGKFKKLF